MATVMEQVTMNQTPGASQDHWLKNRSFDMRSLPFRDCPKSFAKFTSLPSKIGSTSENPIFTAAKAMVRITSHLCGLRYLNSIFIKSVLCVKVAVEDLSSQIPYNFGKSDEMAGGWE